MAINLLSGTGYLLFSGLLDVGDWVVVVDGFEPAWVWRLILAVAGLILYLACIWIALASLNKFIGADDDRHRRAFKQSLMPYIVGSSTTTIGAFLNPISPLLILTSAASAFGGTSALAWMSQLLKTRHFAAVDSDPLAVSRSWIWVVGSALLLLAHIFVLGPAVQF